MGMLNEVVKARLSAGKKVIKLVSFVEGHVEGKGDNIKITWQLPDRTLPQVYFPGKNITYVASCLKDQLGKSDEEMSVLEILTAAQETDKELFTVVSYNTYGLNLAFHEVTPPAGMDPLTGEVGFDDAK